jgi:aminoglycoside phosphotransferase (APT) family kinase protein
MTEGINAPAVSGWLLANVEGLRPPFEFALIAGGRSNLTYAVTDAAGRRIVLRRPPMSHVLPTAHDVGREYRIISALRDTPVPVPAALACCADETVTGRPFYVMDFVDGYVLREPAEAAAVLDEATRTTAGRDLVDVLVAIHRLRVDAIGLGDLARHDGYIERQLRRWHRQFGQSQQQAREVGVYRPVPLVDKVHDLLAARVPPQQGTALVHGDYRLDNTIVSAQGQVQAVLDWELSTLGDALADLGTMMAYWGSGPEPGAASDPLQAAATSLPGFPSRADVAERYAAQSGRDVTNLGFYVAFAQWKLACIGEGVFVRYAANAMGTGGGDAAAIGRAVEDRARQGLASLNS